MNHPPDRRSKRVSDISLSAINAGLVTVLVGFTSSVVIVFQAAQTLGATPSQIGSWILALCLGMGVTGVVLSLRYKTPITTAWSTSGAAMIATGASGISLNEATGAFILTGLLIALSGFSGLFEKMINKIPRALASGMLCGILLQFGIDAFATLMSEALVVLVMVLTFAVLRSLRSRYTVIVSLILGCAVASLRGMVDYSAVHFSLTRPEFVGPVFTLKSFIGISLPLFIVTMASQNVPGLAVLRASDYKDTPVSPLVGWTGFATAILAPFGAFTINLATITAAICISKEAHPDPNKRYIAGVSAGVFYILAGLYGTTIVTLFAVFPREIILAIAGLALLGTIGNAMSGASADEADRESGVITFLVTASGVTFFGIGSAFWGIVAGAVFFSLQKLGGMATNRVNAAKTEAFAEEKLGNPEAKP